MSQYLGKSLPLVGFHLRKLNKAERNYEIHDKELLAILDVFKEWKHSLLGADEPVTVYRDNQYLQYFLTTKVWGPREIQWAQLLANFNFKIVYRMGSISGKPDALSKWPEYCSERGATHRKQSILKPAHFELSVCQRKDRIQISLVGNKVPSSNRLRIKRVSKEVEIPTKGSRMAAGHGIYALEEGSVLAKGQTLVETGIAIGLPKSTDGRLAARSGMASKNRIAVVGGVIDANYTGEVKVILRNHGKEDYQFKAGGRIAQLIVEEVQLDKAMEIDELASVRHTAPRRMRGPSYPTLEEETSRKDKARPPSGPGVGTIGHQPSPGKLRPLTKNLRIGTYLVTPYTSRPSVRPVPVRRIYERRPSGTLCKWKQLNRSTAHQVTDTQSQTTRECH